MKQEFWSKNVHGNGWKKILKGLDMRERNFFYNRRGKHCSSQQGWFDQVSAVGGFVNYGTILLADAVEPGKDRL